MARARNKGVSKSAQPLFFVLFFTGDGAEASVVSNTHSAHAHNIKEISKNRLHPKSCHSALIYIAKQIKQSSNCEIYFCSQAAGEEYPPHPTSPTRNFLTYAYVSP